MRNTNRLHLNVATKPSSPGMIVGYLPERYTDHHKVGATRRRARILGRANHARFCHPRHTQSRAGDDSPATATPAPFFSRLTVTSTQSGATCPFNSEYSDSEHVRSQLIGSSFAPMSNPNFPATSPIPGKINDRAAEAGCSHTCSDRERESCDYS